LVMRIDGVEVCDEDAGVQSDHAGQSARSSTR
jgi:hypothetical protein